MTYHWKGNYARSNETMKCHVANRKNGMAISTFDKIMASLELCRTLDLELNISTTILIADKT